jgi:hypothetical protein
MSDPESVVQRQVEAYNAGDIDAFSATYHDEIEIFDYPDVLRSRGKDRLKATYGEMFRKYPDLRAEIENRIAMGNYVIDFERVSGLPGGIGKTAVPIYEVTGGRIRRVWFIRDENR